MRSSSLNCSSSSSGSAQWKAGLAVLTRSGAFMGSSGNGDYRARSAPASTASVEGPRPRARARACATSGLSMVELLVALAIFSLLLGLGVPSYGQWIAARELANHAEHLAATLMQARSEAVKRQVRVNVCKSADGRQCATAGSWSAGWITFADANRDGSIEEPESVIRR